MRIPVLMLIGLAVTRTLAAPDPVMACRTAHADDPAAHIECLEAALRDSDRPVAAEAGVSADVPVAAPVADPQRPEDFGKEQVKAVEPEFKELTLQIVSTSYNSNGLGTFRTADGQVWRETTPSPERRRLDPDQQYTARVVRSKVGGYRLYVDGVRWMKTVERIE
jgi:hypothetical protein